MHDKDATPIEAIDFETLQESAEKNKESTPGLSKKSILWFVFVSLLLCALIVFFFLPKYVAENRNKITPENQTQVETLSLEEPSQAVEEEPEPLISLSPEESSAFKQQAEELLLEIIGKQKFLENKAVKKWANEEFKIALEQGSRGDEHFRKQAYQQSIAAYEDAAAILMDLERQVEPTLTEHLAKGGLALTQAEKDTAIIHFE